MTDDKISIFIVKPKGKIIKDSIRFDNCDVIELTSKELELLKVSLAHTLQDCLEGKIPDKKFKSILKKLEGI